jgi:hypothetical protein
MNTQTETETFYPCTTCKVVEVARQDGICSWCFAKMPKAEQIAHISKMDAEDAAPVNGNGANGKTHPAVLAPIAERLKEPLNKF